LPKIIFSVPSGAFGNGVAATISLQMGCPVKTIIIANNDNDTLSRLFSTGELRGNSVVRTLSPAIDIGVPYNFERFLFYLLNSDTDAVRNLMESFETNGSLKLAPHLLKKAQSWVESTSVSNSETRKTINECFSKYKYLMDPHTSVAVKSALKRLQKTRKEHSKQNEEISIPICFVSTAHPAKFEQTVSEAIGKKFEIPSVLSSLINFPEFSIQMGSDMKQNEKILREEIISNWKRNSTTIKAKL